MTGELVRYEDTLIELGQAVLPGVVVSAGKKAQYKFIEFFAAHIENVHTRRAYARAAYRFLSWCELKGIRLEQIDPVSTAFYFKELKGELSTPSVKQHLAAIKQLFDWFVVKGVVSFNPAASVKGPRYSPKRGKTPALTREETKHLLNSFELKTIKDYRDRAILHVLFYAWVRVSAVCSLTVADYRGQDVNRTLRFKRKTGKDS